MQKSPVVEWDAEWLLASISADVKEVEEHQKLRQSSPRLSTTGAVLSRTMYCSDSLVTYKEATMA